MNWRVNTFMSALLNLLNLQGVYCTQVNFGVLTATNSSTIPFLTQAKRLRPNHLRSSDVVDRLMLHQMVEEETITSENRSRRNEALILLNSCM